MSDQEVDVFLEHFGVHGMRWGVRKPRGNRDEIFRKRAAEMKDGKPSRQALRAKNKIARKEDRVAKDLAERKAVAENDDKILTARTNLQAANAKYETASATYKAQKQQIGSVAAKGRLILLATSILKLGLRRLH